MRIAAEVSLLLNNNGTSLVYAKGTKFDEKKKLNSRALHSLN